jgi:hypothetical protein
MFIICSSNFRDWDYNFFEIPIDAPFVSIRKVVTSLRKLF